MRVIILAAGQGTRLRPLTDDRPKCLVELGGVSLLERQARVLAGEGFRDLCVVGGYRADQIESRGFRVVRNPRYEQTNMVASLFCVAEAFDGGDDVLVAYGDIVYERRVLRAVAASPAAIALAVARAVRDGAAALGIFLCGTGIGGSIAANKVRGVRAALCHEAFTARMARQHAFIHRRRCLLGGSA